MTTHDDAITYVDHEPSLSMMASYGVPAWATEQRHVHLRGSDRCLKRDGGEQCDSVSEEALELAGHVGTWAARALIAEETLEALKAAPFACQTHLCGSCGGCKAAKVRDLLTERTLELNELRRRHHLCRECNGFPGPCLTAPVKCCPDCTHPGDLREHDDTLARRLEWATGRNGHTLLEQLRAEGLDVIATKPERVER